MRFSAVLQLFCYPSYVEKYWNRYNLTFDDHWLTDLWPDLRCDQVVSSWFSSFFFECRLPRVATWPRSWVRGGVIQTPLTRRGWRRAPARHGLKDATLDSESDVELKWNGSESDIERLLKRSRCATLLCPPRFSKSNIIRWSLIVVLTDV